MAGDLTISKRTKLTANDLWTNLLTGEGGSRVGGGGGGGTIIGTPGHVILDETTTFPQRTNLKFTGTGVTVTDDGAGNNTVVDIPSNFSDLVQGSGIVITPAVNDFLIEWGSTPFTQNVTIDLATFNLTFINGTPGPLPVFTIDNAVELGSDLSVISGAILAGSIQSLTTLSTSNLLVSNEVTANMFYSDGLSVPLSPEWIPPRSFVDQLGLKREGGATGLFDGGLVTEETPTTVRITAGTGAVVNFFDNQTGSQTPVSWDEIVLAVPFGEAVSHVGVTVNGVVFVQIGQPANQGYRDSIFLAIIYNTGSVIGLIEPFLNFFSNNVYQYYDYRQTLGNVVIKSGRALQESDTGTAVQFQVSAGEVFSPGSNFQTDPKSANVRLYATNDPASQGYFEAGGTLIRTTDDYTHFEIQPDPLLGVQEMTNGFFSNQKIWMSQNGNLVVQPGPAEYATIDDAFDAVDRERAQWNDITGFPQSLYIQVGFITGLKNLTDISDDTQVKYTIFYRGAVSGGGGTAPAVLSRNGLTVDGEFVELGGPLIRTTDINLAGFNMTFSGTGRVGIGTTNPQDVLHITAGPIRITNDVTGALSSWTYIRMHAGLTDSVQWRFVGFKDGANSDLRLFDNAGNTTMKWDNETGFVGINTITPTEMLEVVSRGTDTARLKVRSNNIGAGFDMIHNSSGDAFLINRDNGSMRINVNNTGTSGIMILNTGFVGIGTLTPIEQLHVVQTGVNARFLIQSTGGGEGVRLIHDTNGNGFLISYDGILSFRTNGAPATQTDMEIDGAWSYIGGQRINANGTTLGMGWTDSAWTLLSANTFFRLDNQGMVWIRKSGNDSLASGYIFGTLPVGHRPVATHDMFVDFLNSLPVYIQVNNLGTVSLFVPGGTNFSQGFTITHSIE